MTASNETEGPNLTTKDKVDAYLAFYRQQMDHYHALQNVEWKGTFGAWTLLAAASYFSLEHDVRMGPWAIGGLVIAGIHTLWLMDIHRSEEFDKSLWTRYRDQVLRLIDPAGAEGPSGERRYVPRGRLKQLGWLALECGVTWLLALVVLSRAF